MRNSLLIAVAAFVPACVSTAHQADSNHVNVIATMGVIEPVAPLQLAQADADDPHCFFDEQHERICPSRGKPLSVQDTPEEDTAFHIAEQPRLPGPHCESGEGGIRCQPTVPAANSTAVADDGDEP